MKSPESSSAQLSHEEQERPQIEAFLEKENLYGVNAALAEVFDFVDSLSEEARKDLLEHEEAAAADSVKVAERGQKEILAFQSRYGEHVLAAALAKRAENLAGYERPEGLENEYRNFLVAFSNPDLRPRLLAKMQHVIPGWKTWKERRALQRFLYEFYGFEDKDAVFAQGERKGEKMEIFLSLEGQIDLMQAWNEKFDLRLHPRQFEEVKRQMAEVRERLESYKDQPYVAAVLVPYLGEAGNAGAQANPEDVQRTFASLWNLIKLGQQSWMYGEYSDEIGPEEKEVAQLSLRNGAAPHAPGLKFEFLDFGPLMDEELPQERELSNVIKSAHNLPHASLLAAAALHPELMKEVRRLPLPGYQYLQDPDINVPNLDFVLEQGNIRERIELSYIGAFNHRPVPGTIE